MITAHTMRRGALLVVAALTLLAGCAQDVGDIDRTQPNAIKKSDLTGDWYYQRTVVDVPAADDGSTFVGSTDNGGMSKIEWDIQEHFLYARRQTELIKNAGDKEEAGEDYEGEIVAAYRIQSHFDIQREYDSSTGEQTNVVVENSSDKPWSEREYMRVDWAANLVTNYDLGFEATATEPVPYYVQQKTDPETGEPIANPNAPVFDYGNNEDGDKQLEYFDITNKIHAKADTVYFPGYGELPLCFLRSYQFKECGAGEFEIRNSFERIDPDHEYVPKPYKGVATDKFGFFTTDRFVYDDQKGVRQQKRQRYLTRHNMWKDWYDQNGDIKPVADRTLQPIVYHVNREFPEDLKPMARDVADQWNAIFNDVVEAQGYPRKPDERTFILCDNNPVEQGDPAVCGQTGDSPRLGDIRYSFMAYVPKYMKFGLLGLGSSNKDPETGEIASGTAYVYHWNNTATNRTAERVELLNGNKPTDEYIDGVDLQQWVVEQINDENASNTRTSDLKDNESFIQNISQRWKGQRVPITQAEVELQKQQGLDAFLDHRLGQLHRRNGRLNGNNYAPEGKLNQLKNTYIEDMLVGKEMLMAAGRKADKSSVTDQDMAAASVLRGGFGQSALDRAQFRHKYAADHNMYLPAMADDALMGLARELKDEDDFQKVYDTIRKSIYTAVLAHETGHTLGLMHNFGGSEDAVNYADDYWKIRDDGTVGPRMSDPITDQEVNADLYNSAYSSIMDYAGRYTIDGDGVGKYDRAAMLYGYGGKVEVFKDDAGMEPRLMRQWEERDGQVLTFYRSGPKALHYTDWYNTMGSKLYEDSNRMLVDVTDLKNRKTTAGWSTAVVDGKEYHRVPYIYCSHSSYNISDHCLTRDYGADSYERMKNMLEGLDTWYIARSFVRGRAGMTPFGYVRGHYASTFDRIKGWHDLYALYSDLMASAYSPTTVREFLQDPDDGWGGKSWAVKNGFNYLIQTIMMPDVGGHEMQDNVDGSSYYVKPRNFRANELNIGVTDGRYYSTSWGDGDRNCGYFYWNCLHHIGFYLDKIMAIEALTDTRTNFVARSTPKDIRKWEIGYANTFYDQILDVNRAIMGQDYAKAAPYLKDGGVEFPDYAEGLGTAHSDLVDPLATFTIQLYWQVLGQARFPDSYDQSFVEQSRIWIRGRGNGPELDPADTVSFKDPWSGYVYETSDMAKEDSGAERMLRRANLLLRRSEKCDSDGSTPPLVDDCEPAPGSHRPAEATRELKDYLELIKAVAFMNPAMNYGNPYRP